MSKADGQVWSLQLIEVDIYDSNMNIVGSDVETVDLTKGSYIVSIWNYTDSYSTTVFSPQL